MTTAAIILAGGSGSRMGPGPNKPYRTAADRPLLWYSITAFQLAGVDHLVVVVRPEDADAAPAGTQQVTGGRTRTDSEQAGLATLEDAEVEIVMIHDAARPFVTPALIQRLRTAAAARGGAVPVIDPPVPLWRRSGDILVRAPNGVVRVQTPQAFRTEPLRAAYRRAAGADAVGADTAEIMERFGDVEVLAVEGDPLAFKITFDEDLARVEAAARQWAAIVQPPNL
ncbi:MAG: 2-C-methyl-D-erythritol 4-phosphate cytidylyltransferase [Acidimicrobiia bacterium]